MTAKADAKTSAHAKTSADATEAKASTDAKGSADAKVDAAAPREPAKIDAEIGHADTTDDGATPTDAASVAVMPIVPWAPRARTVAWAEQAAPPSVVVFEPDVRAGVIGRAGEAWLHVDASGALVPVTFDRAPTPPILGSYPDDAWTIERRDRALSKDEPTIHELRLMKLRERDRWVPQARNSEQWWHPGTDDELEPHASTHTGMLVYPDSITSIDRIAGRTGAPTLGLHRGRPFDFVETNKGKVYVMSLDDDGRYAQTACEDEECVAKVVRKFPDGEWTLGRRVARGKFSVSVIASSGEDSYVLNNVGKDDGWKLDLLPRGTTLVGMWANAEGGLWTFDGAALRCRDTDGNWHEIALPEQLTAESVAMSQDHTKVWLSGESNGRPAIFTTPATSG